MTRTLVRHSPSLAGYGRVFFCLSMRSCLFRGLAPFCKFQIWINKLDFIINLNFSRLRRWKKARLSLQMRQTLWWSRLQNRNELSTSIERLSLRPAHSQILLVSFKSTIVAHSLPSLGLRLGLSTRDELINAEILKNSWEFLRINLAPSMALYSARYIINIRTLN